MAYLLFFSLLTVKYCSPKRCQVGVPSWARYEGAQRGQGGVGEVEVWNGRKAVARRV